MTDYVELHCHSYFSFLDGASSPEALVERAATLGYPALALTDRHGLYGAIRFWHAAREHGLQPIIGAEIELDSQARLILLAETQNGYANLCRLISAGQLAGQKGAPLVTWGTLAAHVQDLLCLTGDVRAATRLHEIFAPNFWITVQRHYLPASLRHEKELLVLAHKLGAGIVAANDVHYAQRSGQALHDVLTCIRHRTTLPQALASGLLHPNSERYLRPPHEMARIFADLPQALRSTQQIAERCHVNLDFSAQRLPDFPLLPEHTPATYLRHLCIQGLARTFDPVTPRAREQLDHELAVIAAMGLSGYFLVVWDIVRFARQQGIRCQGRGSAANSLVAYLLGITPVDPLRHHLLFERFLSQGTRTMPDIDIDFAADRREEVIQYVYDRYGPEHVGMVCNVVTYHTRSAVRDVAKALAFPPDVINRTAKALDTHSPITAAEGLFELVDEGPDDEGYHQLPWQHLASLLLQMEGVPRHLSIHIGGMLITAAPLVEVVPLERATMPGRVVVQWDKDSVDDAGLIKIDLLSLRTLGAVEEAVQHIGHTRGLALDLEALPLDNSAVYEMLRRADTVGCFQVESRAQAQLQPKLQATCFEDIVISVALIRPGPIQGGMVHPFLRRRQGLEPVVYDHPAMESAVAETLGVIVFQEQVLRVAMSVAGFSPAEADGLRRAMSRSRSEAAMAALRERFLSGAGARGVAHETVLSIWQQLEGFAGFGFCKSHAAAFALVAYQTLYLKAHFPAEYYCALLNHQPLGFYPPEVLAGDARRHGVPVVHPDVNRSDVDCTLEQVEEQNQEPEGQHKWAIRLGLRYVHGLGEVWQERIVTRRVFTGHRPFADLADFCRRTCLPRPAIENLIRSGAMDSLGSGQENTRRNLLWALGGLDYREEGLDVEVPIQAVPLPSLGNAERLAWEYELLGLAPGDQVMSLYREALQRQGVLSTAELAERQDGQRVQVAGWPVVRQRPPTAKGILFITLEDEEGLTNLIVRPDVYERYRDALRNAPLLWVEGHVQREGEAQSVLVYRAAALK